MRVLEFGDQVSAAYAGKLFARWGAEVIRVDRPGASESVADPLAARSLDRYLHGGKQRVAIDYHAPEGGALLGRLAEQCDVLLTDEPATVVDELELLSLGNERAPAIRVSITPFGLSGPYRDWQAVPATLLALGGYTYLMGDPGRAPLTMPGHYPQYQAGQYAYVAALATHIAQLRDPSGPPQTIEISGRLRARSAVARHELQVVQKQYEATERDLTRDIRAAYAELVAAQSALVVAIEVTDVIRRLRDSIQRQVEVGEVPAQELVKADIELLRAELETVRTRNSLDRASQAFNVTIGRAVELPATASEPMTFAPLAAELGELLAEALQSRPEIAGAQSAVKAAQANVALQRSDFRPNLEISLLQNTDVRSSDFFRVKSTGLSLSLAFPIFDTGRIRGRVREAESQVRAFEFVLINTRLLVSQDVTDAFSRVRTTETLVSVYLDAILPGAQDLLSKAEFGYGRGASTLLEFLEAQRTYRATQLEYLVALTDNAKARADLDRAVGRIDQFNTDNSPFLPGVRAHSGRCAHFHKSGILLRPGRIGVCGQHES